MATLVVSRPQPVPRDEPHNSHTHTHSPTSQLLVCAGASATHSHIGLISFSRKNLLKKNTFKKTQNSTIQGDTCEIFNAGFRLVGVISAHFVKISTCTNISYIRTICTVHKIVQILLIKIIIKFSLKLYTFWFTIKS